MGPFTPLVFGTNSGIWESIVTAFSEALYSQEALKKSLNLITSLLPGLEHFFEILWSVHTYIRGQPSTKFHIGVFNLLMTAA